MATTGDLIARTQDLIGEEAADFYSIATEILPAINEGIDQTFSDLEFALPTQLAAIVATSSTSIYPLPTHTVRIRTLKWHPTGQRLIPINTTQYEALEHTFATTDGTPEYYIYDQLSAAGDPVFKAVPAPSTNATTGFVGSIDIRPPTMATTTTAGSTQCSWHAPYHYLPCYWAASRLLRKDHRPEAADDMLAEFHEQKAAYRRYLGHSRPVSIRATEPVGSSSVLSDPSILNRTVTG